MSKITLTEVELDKFYTANTILELFLNSSDFKRFVEDTYGKGTKHKDVANIMSVYSKIGKKISSKKDGKKKEDVPKKETYFTKEVDSTKKSKVLYKLIKDIKDINLRFDQENSSCNTDIRVMIASYIKSMELKDESLGILVDENLVKLAPKTLKDVEYIPKSDRSTIHKVAKEILEAD